MPSVEEKTERVAFRDFHQIEQRGEYLFSIEGYEWCEMCLHPRMIPGPHFIPTTIRTCLFRRLMSFCLVCVMKDPASFMNVSENYEPNVETSATVFEDLRKIDRWWEKQSSTIISCYSKRRCREWHRQYLFVAGCLVLDGRLRRIIRQTKSIEKPHCCNINVWLLVSTSDVTTNSTDKPHCSITGTQRLP